MKKIKIILIILLCLSTGCKKKENKIEEPPDDFYIIFTENNIAEVYSDVLVSDFIMDTNGTILNTEGIIDTTKLGTHSHLIEYEYLDKKYSSNVELTIIDSTPPLILSSGSKTVTIGHNKNLCNLIMFADNYDKKAKCIVEGDYDLNKIGTYSITYKVTDTSNNTETAKVKLNVIAKSNSSSSTSSRATVYFKDALSKYKNTDTEVGIDVSKWQGNINFEKVKKAGATFVIMRIGVQKAIDGELEIDPYYYQNIKNAKAAGLKVGVYLYSIATSKEEAIEQAKWVINKLDGTDLDLPIVFDWESWGRWNTLNLSLYDINDIADSFLNTVEAEGYKGMLYSSKYYLQNIWENKKDYPVWLAHYTSETDYQGKYNFWQLCDTGRIDGINGYVDINVMYK
jgi:Lyzozyme M1 (1,4-beta-N-acetylmuramidase)